MLTDILRAVHFVILCPLNRLELYRVKTTKTRDEVRSSNAYTYGLESQLFPFFNTSTTGVGSLFSTQLTESEGHYYGLLGKGSADIGGEFFTVKCEHSFNCPYLEVWSGSAHDSSFFRGRLFPAYNHSQFSLESNFPITPSSSSDLDALGTTAISRTIPTNPVVSLATFFGELRQGFPKMIGSDLFKSRLRNTHKKGSSEYLNWEFGWKPMIADLKKWIYAARKGDAIWSQYLRDSGRRVRRRYNFPVSEVVEETTTMGVPFPVIVLPIWEGGNNQFTLVRRETITRRRWFSGAFTYHADVDPDVMRTWKGHLQRLQKLYGVKITPDVIWNLAPWSWAVDWFSNTGDVITNISRFASDELVMPYGYMMETSVLKVEYDMLDVTPKGYHIPHLTQTFTNTVKVRRQATPYGFGVDLSDLTGRQLAIIAALGLSRA
jgi:hypothetical protein